MTRPKRAERFREIWFDANTDVAVRAYANVLAAVTRGAVAYEDVLRGASKCRDNAARYRAERDAIGLVHTAALRDLDAVRAELEARRLRSARATELLRASFSVRADCKLVDEAAEDACAELAAIKARRCGTCANFDDPHVDATGYSPSNPGHGQGWCETFNVATYAVMSCPDWRARDRSHDDE